MKNHLRTYGDPPYNVAVIHGGPGTAGGMAPLARELALRHGVLEPLQTALSITGQVEELKGILEERADLPVTLIGHSWGAWLAYILAARHPSLVIKLILVSSGGFEDKYAETTHENRLSRLHEEEKGEVLRLLGIIRNRSNANNNAEFARLGELFFKTDAYDPIPQEPPEIDVNLEIYRRVWGEATELRRSGKLLEMGREIASPVVAIHGDYDSHPAEGVGPPLSTVLTDFRFILLEKCGHKPWIERQARERFYRILEEEL
jgi:pimeloyl-ACP methyl ester carboxylesterase